MHNAEIFRRYFDAFEETYRDNNWDRIAPYFADDMIYNTAEGQRLESGDAALAYLEASVDELDRRFDSRAFDGTPEITGEGDTVTMLFKVRYTLHGTPDLVLSGEEIAIFRDGRIQQMDDIFDEAAVDGFASWMERYSTRLSAP